MVRVRDQLKVKNEKEEKALMGSWKTGFELTLCVCVSVSGRVCCNLYIVPLYSDAMSLYHGYIFLRSLPSRSVAGVRKLKEDLELIPLLTVVTFVSLQVGDRVVRGLVSRLRSHPDIQTLVYWVSVEIKAVL